MQSGRAAVSSNRDTSASQQLFARAQMLIPGGVNSPVRAFKAVGGQPLFIARADGSKVFDIDGNSYIDYVGSWGPMIMGHNHPAIREAVVKAAERGLSYGAPTAAEVRLAELICSMNPNVDMVRLVNSGTEAVMGALRLARAFTGRQKIIKFAGCYHGHTDSMLVKAGSGAMTMAEPDSLGVPIAVAQDTLVCRFNNLDKVSELLAQNDVACVIVEPVAANMGVVLPTVDFLAGLRTLCDQYGALLVFDEVITGFRLAPGGAQQYFNVSADLVTYGKIIGGGMPVGAYGGRKEIMQLVSPSGGVYQAGTLSGNPIATAAGIAQLELLQDGAVYLQLKSLAGRLAEGLSTVCREAGLVAHVTNIESLLCAFFSIESAQDYDDVRQADTSLYAKYFSMMLEQSVYLAPSQFEAMFISAAHTDDDIDQTLERAELVVSRIMKEGK
ncbi:MAG: glutamate-1-semialdehyde 2,1-aminomutase [Coriobacteriia bacterium]|nr:glutamate-1-semialdehyde 2,1-aminomutase [Coriobacteriia bacterium]